MSQTKLFDDLPREKPKVRMRVVGAGNHLSGGKGIEFECWKCGYNTGWIEDSNTITENRRGLPCPKCNE